MSSAESDYGSDFDDIEAEEVLTRCLANSAPQPHQAHVGTGFLDLPPEIRNEIYMLTLTLPIFGSEWPHQDKSCYSDAPMAKQSESDRATTAERRITTWNCTQCHLLRWDKLEQNLLQTSKRIYAEAAPVYYGHIHAYLRTTPHATSLLRAIRRGEEQGLYDSFDDCIRDSLVVDATFHPRRMPILPRCDLITLITQEIDLASGARVSLPQRRIRQLFPRLTTMVLEFRLEREAGLSLKNMSWDDLKKVLSSNLDFWRSYTIVVEMQALPREPHEDAMTDEEVEEAHELQNDIVGYLRTESATNYTKATDTSTDAELKEVLRGRIFCSSGSILN